jgi:hypothetical protein
MMDRVIAFIGVIDAQAGGKRVDEFSGQSASSPFAKMNRVDSPFMPKENNYGIEIFG